MENIIIAIIQVVGTIIVAVFTYLANHKIRKLSDIKEELRIELKEQHKETLQKIAELEKKLAELENTTDKNDIGTVRNRILAFENLCRLNIDHEQIKKHQYDSAFKDVDKWDKYHEKYPDMNGEIDVAIENIKEDYKIAKF